MDIQAAANRAISFTDLVGRLASAGTKALPMIDALAAWAPIPYVGAIVHALDVAAPYVQDVAMAAPIVERAISQGVPIAEVLQQNGPALFNSLKQLYAIAASNDPTRKGLPPVTAADVSDEQAFHFAGNTFLGRRWTDEEYQRWWDHAQGDH